MQHTDPISIVPTFENTLAPQHIDTSLGYDFLTSLFQRMKDFPYACISFPYFSKTDVSNAATLDLVIPAGDVGVWHAACLKEVNESQIIHLTHHQGVTFRLELSSNFVFQLHLVLEEKLDFPEADLMISGASIQDSVKVAPLRHVLTYLLHANHIANKEQIAFQSYFKSLPAEQKRKLTNELVKKYANK